MFIRIVHAGVEDTGLQVDQGGQEIMDQINLIINIGLIIAIAAGMDAMIFLLVVSTSCGGRENCGKRFCPIGVLNDYLYPTLILLPIVLVITVTYVLVTKP